MSEGEEEKTRGELQELQSGAEWQANHHTSTSWGKSLAGFYNWNVIGDWGGDWGDGVGGHLIHIRAINNSFKTVFSSLLLSPFRFPVLTINYKRRGEIIEKKKKGILNSERGCWRQIIKLGKGINLYNNSGSYPGGFFNSFIYLIPGRLNNSLNLWTHFHLLLVQTSEKKRRDGRLH